MIPTLDMTRNALVSTLGSNPTDVAKKDSEGEIIYFNGDTELTVGRPCSGKHVIEVSAIRKAT